MASQHAARSRSPWRHRDDRHAEVENSRVRGCCVRDILVDWRPKAGVRFSPFFYTQDEELDIAIAAVDEIVSGRAVAD